MPTQDTGTRPTVVSSKSKKNRRPQARKHRWTYRVGHKVCQVFFRKIKDTLFILSSNFVELGVASPSAGSRVGFQGTGAGGATQNLPMCKAAPPQRTI